MMDLEQQNSESNKILIDYQKKQEEEMEKIKAEEKKLEDEELEMMGGDFNFTYHMPNISLKQDDIIKMTAQYVAINGEDFLIALTERKRHDSTFDFLKPSNSKFNYLTRMVDSYVKIIGFQTQDYQKLHEAVSDKRFYFYDILLVDVFERSSS